MDLLVDITSMALGQRRKDAAVRDHGLLESAVHRPRSSSFGVERYPSLFDKGAALMQSLARNHVFVDGNKRAAWNCTATFLELNGAPLITPVDEEFPAVVVGLRAGDPLCLLSSFRGCPNRPMPRARYGSSFGTW